MLDVSVVICAYTENRWPELVAAVESVRKQSQAAEEIIVVADHNPRLLASISERMPWVIGVANHEQKGLGGARNSGIAAAKGEIVAFLDDDAAASPDWIKHLRAGYADPNVVGVGGSIMPAWNSGRPGWFPAEFDWVVGCTYRGMPEKATTVRNLIGCNMSYRREVFKTVGTFKLGYGCDETEFCIRLRRHMPQKTLLYQPLAAVYHQVPASRATWRHFLTRCYFEGGSKAVVSWLVGNRDGLASERAYTFKTLPKAVLQGFSDTVWRGDRAGVARAGAIVAGLTMTTAGYVAGKARLSDAARKRGWAGQLQKTVT